MATLSDMRRKLEQFGNEIQNLSGKVITILPDLNGMIDRQCPREECKTQFKVSDPDWEKAIDLAFCPSCGHQSSKSDFITDEHREAAKKGISESLLRNWNNSTSIPNSVVNLESTQDQQNQTTCNTCQTVFAMATKAHYCPCCGNRQK